MNVPVDVTQVLAPALATRPGVEAIVTRSGSVTYAGLDALANRAARALVSLGVRAGDRVAACLPNDIDIIAAFHGVMRIGAVWVGVGQNLAAPEKAYILRDCGVSLLLCDLAAAEEIAQQRAAVPDLLRVVTVGSALGVPSRSEPTWNELLAAASDAPVSVEIDPYAPAAIAYTSGTTGFPKGAVQSQRNLLLPGAYLSASRGYDETLRKGDCFPLTILNMLVLTTLLTAQVGGCAVIMDSLRAGDIANWISRERVMVWNGPPPLLYTLAHDPSIEPEQLASLTEVWSGGAECPAAIRSAFESKFDVRICSTFGQTEAPTVLTIESPRRPHLPGATGMPLPHLKVSIRDPDGKELPQGEIGEICIASRDPAEIEARLAADWERRWTSSEPPPVYTPMLGYWQQPDKTALALRDGVLHTGDAGSLDRDGNLIVSDRIVLMVNRGGANVYPAEIERVVTELDAVESCAVVGVPDERLGQRVGILLQFKTGAEPSIEDILDHCRSQLASYKVPELAAAVEGFPRNAMGKIDRRRLNETAAGLLRDARVSRPA